MASYPDSTEIDRRLAALIERMERAGHVSAAAPLRFVRGTAHTTSSEWLGDLGLALKDVRRRTLAPAFRAELDWLTACAREAWPDL